MKSYLLDTNICIYTINKRPIEVYKKFKRVKLESIYISSVTVHELYYGVQKSNRAENNLKVLDEFIQYLNIISFSDKDAVAAAEIRVVLEKAGKPIGPYDLMIAAQAFRGKYTLVTNNEREFKRIKNLEIENWV